MEGLLQAITGLDVQPDLLSQGVTSGEFLIPMGPLFGKVGDCCTVTVSQACLSPEELIQIRFLGLALDFLHQHHQRRVWKSLILNSVPVILLIGQVCWPSSLATVKEAMYSM